MSCDNCAACGKCNGAEEIHGAAFAVKKYLRVKHLVTWHTHSKYRKLDVWVGKTHELGDTKGRNAGIYKAYPAKGHVIVGATIPDVERAIREYLGEGSA